MDYRTTAARAILRYRKQNLPGALDERTLARIVRYALARAEGKRPPALNPGLKALLAGLGDAFWAADEAPALVYAAFLQPAGARDAFGRFYTPPALVDFILKRIFSHTDAADKTIADLSAGAGVFLTEFIARVSERCSRKKLRRVIEKNIFGFDIDGNAVRLASFAVRRAAARRGVSDLAGINIARADSLDGTHRDLRRKFDIVIGNPPYLDSRRIPPAKAAAYRERFASARGKLNTFSLFIERGLDLLADGGLLGYVLPATILRNDRYRAVRKLLLDRCAIKDIVAVKDHSFRPAVVDTAIIIARKSPRRRGRIAVRVADSTAELRHRPDAHKRAADFLKDTHLRFNIFCSPDEERLLAKLTTAPDRLHDLCDIKDGISTGFKPFPEMLLGKKDGKRFVNRLGTSERFAPALHKPVIDGGDFSRFGPVDWKGVYIRYDKRTERTPKPAPGRSFNCQLRERSIFERAEKVLSRQTARELVTTVDRNRFYTRNSVHTIFFLPRFTRALSHAALACFLNSRLANFFYTKEFQETGRVFPQVHIRHLGHIPADRRFLAKGGRLDRLAARIMRDPAPETRDRIIEEAEAVLCKSFRLTAREIKLINGLVKRP